MLRRRDKQERLVPGQDTSSRGRGVETKPEKREGWGRRDRQSQDGAEKPSPASSPVHHWTLTRLFRTEGRTHREGDLLMRVQAGHPAKWFYSLVLFASLMALEVETHIPILQRWRWRKAG
jgi:hypothetical protein